MQGSKDTKSDDVLLRTYSPSLMTFEEEIGLIMEENRRAAAHSKHMEITSTNSEQNWLTQSYIDAYIIKYSEQ